MFILSNVSRLFARIIVAVGFHNTPGRGRPAYLDGYVRVFGFKAPPWGGSVASVVPKEGARVYGRFYLMTPEEVLKTKIPTHVHCLCFLRMSTARVRHRAVRVAFRSLTLANVSSPNYTWLTILVGERAPSR